MADIFISYAREDRTRVQPVAAALSAHGWTVWWDRQIHAGELFDQVIAEALGGARCVLAIWSQHSITSDWVRDEADEGRRRGILIPLLIDDVRPPLGFGRIHTIELKQWDGDESSEAFRTLLSDLTALLGPPAAPPAPPAAAAPVESPVRLDAIERATREASAEPQPVGAHTGTTAGRFKLPRFALAIAVLCVVASAALYKFGTDNRDGSQPRAETRPWSESALRLSAVVTDGGKPLTGDVRYDVYEAAPDAEGTRKRVDSSEESQPRFSLPAGRYYVTATRGNASAGTDVEVAAAKMTLQTLNLRAGILVLSSVLASGGKPLAPGVRYDVFEAVKDAEGKRKPVTASDEYHDAPRFTLPAGRYYVTATHGSASAAAEILIKAGDEPTRQTLDLHAGVLILSAVRALGGEPLQRGVSYDVFEAAKDADGKRKRVTSSDEYHDPPRFPLPAGRYHVAATYGSAAAGMEIDVAAGDQGTRQTLNLQAGVFAVSAVLAAGGEPLKRGVQYDVFLATRDGDSPRTRVTGSDEYHDPPRFQLTAGRYYITAAYGAASAGSEVSVSAGDQLQQSVLALNAGLVDLSAVPIGGGKPLARDVRYDVFELATDAEGNRKPVTASDEFHDPPRFPLPAGRYHVTAVSETGQAEAEIAVSAGQRQRVELRLRPKQKR